MSDELWIGCWRREPGAPSPRPSATPLPQGVGPAASDALIVHDRQ